MSAARLKPTLVDSQLRGVSDFACPKWEGEPIHDLDNGHLARLVLLIIVLKCLGQPIGKDAHEAQQDGDLEGP